MIADPEVYVLFLECHRLFAYADGHLIRKVRTGARTRIGDLAGYSSKTGYRLVWVFRRLCSAHRLIFLMHYGWLPDEVDHIRGLSNQIENLRAATHQQNACNVGLRSTNTSGVKGVCWHRKAAKWMAQIRINGYTKYLGLFADIKEAEAVVRKFREEHHKEFARHK